MDDAKVKESWAGGHVRDTTPEPTSEFVAFWVWLAVIAIVIFGAGLVMGYVLWA